MCGGLYRDNYYNISENLYDLAFVCNFRLLLLFVVVGGRGVLSFHDGCTVVTHTYIHGRHVKIMTTHV